MFCKPFAFTRGVLLALAVLTASLFTPAVLADTVGFIRDLPHDLVAAFRSTLCRPGVYC